MTARDFDRAIVMPFLAGQLMLAGFYDCCWREFLYRNTQMMIARLTASRNADFIALYPEACMRLAPCPAAALAELGGRQGWDLL